MMKRSVFVLSFLIIASAAFSQLPDHNTYLIGNIDNHSTYSALWGYTDPSGRQYAILGCDSGTAFVEVTDSLHLREIQFISGFYSSFREMKTYSHYAYIVSEATNSYVQIVDLQYLPDSVSLVTTYSFPQYSKSHSISQSGPYIYLNGSNPPFQGVQILDVTTPLAPIVKGSNNTRYVHDCRVRNDTVWTCNILNFKVSIIDATNKDNLVEIRNFTTLQASPHNCALTADRKYLFVTHETLDPGSLEIWDVRDISNITYVGNWQPTGITSSITHNVEIYGRYAIVAHYTAGVRILDISNPEAPNEIAWYDTRPQDNNTSFDGCWAVYMFNDGKIIASDISNGLFVIKSTVITNLSGESNPVPLSFELKQNYPNPFNPQTTIEYNLPSVADATITVYDALGKEIMKQFNQKQPAGSHRFTFDASGFPSGVYFYRLNALGNSVTRKMLLIR